MSCACSTTDAPPIGPGSHTRLSETAILIGCCLLAVLVFAFDVSMSVGINGGIPYVAVVLLSLWSGRPRATVLTALGCSFLAALEYFFLASGDVNHREILLNDAIDLVVIWMTAALCLQLRRRFERQLSNAEQLRRSETTLRSFGRILDNSRNEIYIFDAETLRFLHANQGARENSGYTMDELRELTPCDLKPEFTAEQFRELIAPLKTGHLQIVRFRTLHQRKDGSNYPVEVHLQLLDFADKPAFVGIALDITTQLQQEAEIRLARESAEAANRSKSEFLASMSHEIRTPLTAVLGYADILSGDLTREEALDAATTIKNNGEYLLSILNDILDLSKVEADQLTLEPGPCSPAAVVVDVVALLHVRAEKKGLTLQTALETPVPKTITTDCVRLRQILTNIVGNAVKFTDSGSVRIALRLLEEQGTPPRLRFDVTDTGIGIPAARLEQIFQPFSQAESSTTRRFGGTGLGLTISRKLARLLGGEITVTSTPGEGSTFSLTIPAGPLQDTPLISEFAPSAKRPTEPAADDSDSPLAGCRVLLAEDAPDNQRLVSFLLTKHGAEVTVADNGQIAVDQAQSAWDAGRPFDVILMDVQMPVMDGYVATETLRAAGYDRPILALTAHALTEERRHCLDAGCNEFLSKPVNRATLLQTLRKYFQAAETRTPDAVS